MRLKTKLSLGLIFLFVVILIFGILGIAGINRLNQEGNQVLENNQESLVYTNNMFESLENIRTEKDALSEFAENLSKQEANITEPGEKRATEELRKNFDALSKNPADASNYPGIRRALIQIQELNEMAIFRKSAAAGKTAENARFWLSVLFTILTLVAFTFIYNLPGIISNPIRALSEGISEIANRNYKKRVNLKQPDEFGELAHAFNTMAERLDEYENSNVSQIKFEKRRIETIINQMRDGIIGLDAKKNILFLNEVAEKLLGLKESDIIGRYAADIAVKNDLMRNLLKDQDNHKEWKIYANNKESYFDLDTLSIRDSNELIGEVIVLRNITPFHELNEAKTNFIATVSHELKTPISSIKMSAQLLTDERVGSLDPEQQSLIASIREDADRLLKITGELLNMTQVETGNIQLMLRPVDPSAIIEEAVLATEFLAHQKRIEIKKELGEPPGLFQADAEKTTWILINFLTNAIKFSPEGGQILLSLFKKENEIAITVADSGPGIDEKYRLKIFDRYFTVPGNEKSGTGLGLAISKEFIEAQGGTIWVDSQPGAGSLFGFSLKIL